MKPRIESAAKHPATLSRSSATPPVSGRRRAEAPHAATLSRSASAQAPQKTEKSKPDVLAQVSAELPAIDAARLARNWDALVAAPPGSELRLEAARWNFECHGVSGRVNYEGGTHNIAQVMLSPPQQKSVSYWFMVDARRPGRIVNAEPRAYTTKDTARPFSTLPSQLQLPIRRLLEALYAGTYDV